VYVPRPFAIDDEAAADLLGESPAAQLITATDTGPLATLLPWVVDLEQGSLISHMARPNPQWRTPWQGLALVLAEGPDGYVSPSWYASKAEHGRVVPTWDYIAVHVYGELTVHDDEGWVENAVRLLTDRHEHQRTTPWSVGDAPPDYIAGQLRGIVGIEVVIDRIEASVKMSQNKSEDDAAGVIAGFADDGNDVLSGLVHRYAGSGYN
jgi:transcriptional regulator